MNGYLNLKLSRMKGFLLMVFVLSGCTNGTIGSGKSALKGTLAPLASIGDSGTSSTTLPTQINLQGTKIGSFDIPPSFSNYSNANGSKGDLVNIGPQIITQLGKDNLNSMIQNAPSDPNIGNIRVLVTIPSRSFGTNPSLLKFSDLISINGTLNNVLVFFPSGATSGAELGVPPSSGVVGLPVPDSATVFMHPNSGAIFIAGGLLHGNPLANLMRIELPPNNIGRPAVSTDKTWGAGVLYHASAAPELRLVPQQLFSDYNAAPTSLGLTPDNLAVIFRNATSVSMVLLVNGAAGNQSPGGFICGIGGNCDTVVSKYFLDLQ